jgi:hypothetical protein
MLQHSHALSVVQATRKLLLSLLAPETLKLKSSAFQEITLALEVLPLRSSSSMGNGKRLLYSHVIKKCSITVCFA